MGWVFSLCRTHVPVLSVGSQELHLIDCEGRGVFIEDVAFDVEGLPGNSNGERGTAAPLTGRNWRRWGVGGRSDAPAPTPAAATSTLRALRRHHGLQGHFERGG